MSYDVELFLLCHNRVQFLPEVVHSSRAQTGVKFRCIVSDNSTTDAVENWLNAQSLPDVEIRRRRPVLPVVEHLNLILSEVQAPYVMLFHDDDLLYPAALSRLVKTLKDHPEAVAAGGNADLILENKVTSQTFQDISEMEIIRGPSELCRAYLKLAKKHPPFPSYLYRTSAVRGLRFDSNDGGKYTDAAFLAKLAEHGPLVWLPDRLMAYRRHSGNDSGTMDLSAIYKLIDFMCANNWLKREDPEVRRFVRWHELGHLKSAALWKAREFKLATSVGIFFLRHPGILLKHFWRKFRSNPSQL